MEHHMSYFQKHRDITESRINNFYNSSMWNSVNIQSILFNATSSGSPHVELKVWSAPDQDRPTFAYASKQEYRPAKVGDTFGPSWSTHWFHVTVRIPKDDPKWVGQEIQFHFDAGCEGMIWTEDGRVEQGLTGGGMHVDYLLTPKSSANEPERRFYIEIACNGLFGNALGTTINPPDPNRYFKLSEAKLAAVNREAINLLRDIDVLRGMFSSLPSESPQAWRALKVANEIVNVFDLARPDESVRRGRELAKEVLSSRSGEATHLITAIGNCHIDTAWLWPFDETKRKVARSWSTQLQFMKRYPDYMFAASQAQQFEWLKQLYPELFGRVVEMAKAGQFVPIGATWVEMDCNLPSGESLVRQFLLGQRFFEQHFGQRCKVFWLPDTFGYSSQLPQIVRLADAKYFFTQKLSWNNINKFPHTTFRWIGLDNSWVLTHMTPTETYAASVSVDELLRNVQNHHDIGYSNESLLLYGHGDGGGGPMEDMLERLARLKDVDPLPRVKHGHPNDFYESIERQAKELVSWKGELYLEFHRGTYTSQAHNKQSNRQAEFLLRDAELLSIIAATLRSQSHHYYGLTDRDHRAMFPEAARGTFEYPIDELNRLWKLVCLNQFHDVIPGSSIEMVYKDSARMYTDIIASGKRIRKDALDAILGDGDEDSASLLSAIAVVNTCGWERTEIIIAPLPSGDKRVAQYVSALAESAVVFEATGAVEETGRYWPAGTTLGYVAAVKIPGASVHAVDLSEQTDVVPVDAYRTTSKDNNNRFVLENLYVRATFDDGGRLVSFVDRRVDREVVPEGFRGNQLQLYDDQPIYWDAWDIEIYHLEKYRELAPGKVQVVETGPLVARLLVEVEISPESSLKQWITLTATSPRLEFTTQVDWHETYKCLKVEFPWDIVSDFATYETQFGHIERPTHRNSSWDLAKFEVCGHKFFDLSEYGYGVALLNDCKYGHSVEGNRMRISLLRSPKHPDAHCDMGRHTFRYAVYPHLGSFNESEVVPEAYKFNVPLHLSRVQADLAAHLRATRPIFTITRPGRWPATSRQSHSNPPNIVLDTVKRAEDDPDAIVVRMYEAYGGHARVQLGSCLNIRKATYCNLLEDETATPNVEQDSKAPPPPSPIKNQWIVDSDGGGKMDITFKPFQVVSVKLYLNN
ncbi:Glycoside hydrolase, 38 vacuolar alpha mannosidase [Spiromyces aspiralis]|uniref:Glycoside hydrolase, 38 vacuolar alpha mannosidase n=1 Tax=Spiromyces aspiralis TaxID=68401 RepID=A0ACC1HIX2_9FUNG|nr:Glycoside hydrolase, 38 vacuolar alpha mannosidase [Spiromyces aspiralis]